MLDLFYESPMAQGITLLYAKTMLFIDDNQPQSLKTHIFLNERMSAYGNHGLSILDSRSPHRPLALFQAAG